MGDLSPAEAAPLKLGRPIGLGFPGLFIGLGDLIILFNHSIDLSG